MADAHMMLLNIASESLPEKNTFIDYPPTPMADSGPPTNTAPAFLQRFKLPKRMYSEEAVSTVSTGCPSESSSPDDYPIPCPILADSSAPEEDNVSGEPLQLPSLGSANHNSGDCNPCAWHWKAGGCRTGASCTHCHLCPEGTRKAKKKAKAAAFKHQTEVALAEQEQDEHREAVPVDSGSTPSPVSITGDGLKSSLLQAYEAHDTVDAIGTVKVKNTFIQLDMPAASSMTLDSSPPLKTAPGDFFKRLFKTQAVISEPAFLRTPEPGFLSPRADLFPPGDLFPPTPTCSFRTQPFASNLANIISIEAATAQNAPSYVVEKPLTGIEAHAAGKCTPCAYFAHKKDGCRLGDSCQFCHTCKKGEIKKRKKDLINQMKAAGTFVQGYAKKQQHVSSNQGLS